MNNMETAAADDMARAVAANRNPYTPPRIKPQARKSALARMVDLFCDKAAADQPVTIGELHREGFTDQQVDTLLPEATRLARNRMNTH
jgi:hypothetical protein